MASSCSFFFTVTFLLFTLMPLPDSFVQGFGINYGQIANNLPSPTRVAGLLQSLNVSRVKLYDADPNVLTAFSNSNVDFIIGLGNDLLPSMSDQTKAQSWIQQHVQTHSQTKISCILVGNEIFKGTDTQLWASLFPAMQSVYKALVTLGLDKQVIVTTAHSLDILGTSYPPSSGAFREDLIEYMQSILNFQAQIKSPFLINAYPFFAYMDSPDQISLDYVLFQPNQGMTDPVTNLHYDNMLYAQIDAVYSAIKALGHTDIQVKISETGWPSKGDQDEVGATLQNAGLYNSNLLKRIQQGQSTPGKPSVPIDVYVFALFNENMKPGPASERNYGLFYPNGTHVYSIGMQGSLPTIIYSSANTNAFSVLGVLIVAIACLICELENIL
ncbi:hypothetical protein ACFE04_028822 [Oxalis oulophora]